MVIISSRFVTRVVTSHVENGTWPAHNLLAITAVIHGFCICHVSNAVVNRVSTDFLAALIRRDAAASIFSRRNDGIEPVLALLWSSRI